MIKIIAKRYAKALVELAHEKKVVDQVRADLAAFAEAVEGNAPLRKLFASPAFTPAAKKAVVGELAARLGLQPTTTRFLSHLAETGRARNYRDMQQGFEELLAERQNRARARVITAAALAPGELGDIKKKLESLTGKQVEIDAQTDTAVIGGVRAQIGSVIYDGTIKNQLSKVRERLAK